MHDQHDDLPYLPYAGTSGHSGGDSSHDRAVKRDTTGRTKADQHTARLRVSQAGARGLTYIELGELEGWGHGAASGVLSNLQKKGDITRVKERRLDCEVYLLPEHVGDREVSPYRPNNGTPQHIETETRWVDDDGNVLVHVDGMFGKDLDGRLRTAHRQTRVVAVVEDWHDA